MTAKWSVGVWGQVWGQVLQCHIYGDGSSLSTWRDSFMRMSGRNLAFVIGGPDGHADAVLQRANQRWSLGELTLPHMLVRLIVVEQLYRAAMIQAGHPYHRA